MFCLFLNIRCKIRGIHQGIQNGILSETSSMHRLQKRVIAHVMVVDVADNRGE